MGNKNIFIKRLVANVIDFILFILLLIIALLIIQNVQKALGLYETTSTFLKIVNFILNTIIILSIYFLIFGMLFSKMKRSLGKKITGLYIHPFKGKLTSGRIFVREFLLKQIFFFFIVMFLAYKMFSLMNLPDIFGNGEFFTGTFILILVSIFTILNLLSFILIGHPVHNVLLKTTVKFADFSERANATCENDENEILDDFTLNL